MALKGLVSGLLIQMSFVTKTFCRLKLQMNQSRVAAANIESETCLAPDMPENLVDASTADSDGDNVDVSLALTCEEVHVANAAVSSVISLLVIQQWQVIQI